MAINGLKRFAADFEQSSGKRILPYKAPSTGRTIAVIGGGIEGLSCAYFLARLGHSPTIYEATTSLGGILRKAIARERLPMDILDWDIEGVLDMGVSVEYEKSCGKDFTIPQLLDKGFNAVCVTTGGWDSRLARNAERVIDQHVPGMYLLLDAVKESTNFDVPVKDHCAILATDKIAVKAAETLINKGAKLITLLYQQDMETIGISKEEMDQARDNGIRMIFQAAVQQLKGEGENLNQIVYLDMDCDLEETLDVQTVFVSYGRLPELIFTSVLDDNDNRTSAWLAIAPYKSPDQYHEKGLFSENDMKTDYSAAIRAIAASRRTAASAHHVMYGNEVALAKDVLKAETDIQDVDLLNQVDSVPRQVMPLRTAEELTVKNELEKGFTPEMAKTEASRCLQCGLVCYEQNC